ncbi:NADH:ubiquinone oxidoreductase [Fontisubflavum oceani]|uniref:NADH:ubiquinone oxidoreductase n=1 Tax=Fontisubflavum oceani TaxID=2978973 RepID=UPI0025B397DD|nr:NADH:ubiquinone oxidoreductase [Fontisubflavum oceani]WJY21671.1 NADH:ubiquinone oxidoreductase [Fontisubflavum oceani]
MNEPSGAPSCATICWIAGGVLGLLLMIILISTAGWGFFGALIVGALVGIGAAYLLKMLFCNRAQTASETMARPASTAASAPPAPVVTPAPEAEPETPAPTEAVEPTPVSTPAPTSVSDAGTQPQGLAAAREGGADDLKKMKGVGPKLEQMLNEMGYYHFDQIAAWTADEVAWVDANLKGFKGRVSRDTWVEQAKLLAAGGETDFSKKVDEGDVY